MCHLVITLQSGQNVQLYWGSVLTRPTNGCHNKNVMLNVLCGKINYHGGYDMSWYVEYVYVHTQYSNDSRRVSANTSFGMHVELNRPMNNKPNVKCTM